MLVDEALDAIKTRLQEIDGLTVTTDPGVTPVVPMALITDGTLNYHSTFGRGYDQLDFVVTVYVSRADSSEGADDARRYKSGHGVKSIRAALETTPTPTDNLEAVVAVSGDVGVADAGGQSYITLQVAAKAELLGKAL